MTKYQTSNKVTAKTGIETEESLLNESAARETSFYSQINDLENEAKQLRHELERVTAERDRTVQENNDIGKDKEDRNMECKKLRTELREIKYRETRLLTDYSELEEENIALQKQVSLLKSSQVEFESLKHETRRLEEEMEILNGQVEELSHLKKIAEKHMEEALEALQSEREAKYALKKELDQHVNRESFYNISNLAYSIRGMTDEAIVASDDELNDLKRIALTDDNDLTRNETKVDLFSEVHVNELRKLEKQLEQLEKEKVALQQTVRDQQGLADRSHAELQAFIARLSQFTAHVDSLQHLQQNVAKSDDDCTKSYEKAEKAEHDALANEKLLRSLNEYKRWLKLSAKEIELLKNDLKELEKLTQVPDATIQLKNELTNVKIKLLDGEKKCYDLENDLRLVKEFAVAAGTSCEDTQSNLAAVSEDLAQLYHHVCTVNGQTPNRIVLEHEKSNDVNVRRDNVQLSKLEMLRNNLTNDIVLNDLEGLNDTSVIAKHSSTIVDQIKHLRTAIECTIELSKTKTHHNKNDDGRECKLLPSNDCFLFFVFNSFDCFAFL